MGRPHVLTAVLAVLLLSPPLHAADTIQSKDAPDLTAVRDKIKAKDYAAALALVKPLVATHDNPDVFNLYAFTSRKTGDMKTAATFYAKALELDPRHLSALEYQGQMFVEQGDMKKARANLEQLVTLCPQGCEERADLDKAIKANAGKRKPK